MTDYFHAQSDSRTPDLCVRLSGKQGRMRNNLMPAEVITGMSHRAEVHSDNDHTHSLFDLGEKQKFTYSLCT